jgi:hypothetical protein
MKIKIVKMERTCWAAPSQWEAIDSEQYPYYFRYRHGLLSVRKGKKKKNIMTAVQGEEIFSYNLGDEYAGYMEYKQLKDILKDVMELPEIENVDNS